MSNQVSEERERERGRERERESERESENERERARERGDGGQGGLLGILHEDESLAARDSPAMETRDFRRPRETVFERIRNR